MKRRTLVLTIIAGLLVFLGVLVLYLPASWFAAMLPPPLRCTELGGSLWQGECLGLSMQGVETGGCHLESRARQCNQGPRNRRRRRARGRC